MNQQVGGIDNLYSGLKCCNVFFAVCTGGFHETTGSFHSPDVNSSYSCDWLRVKSNTYAKETLAIQLTIKGEMKPCSLNSGVLVSTSNLDEVLAHSCTPSPKPMIVRSPLEFTKLWVSLRDYYFLQFPLFGLCYIWGLRDCF